MFYLHDASIRNMVVHRIGNKAKEEACFYSEHETPIREQVLNDLLRAFFTSPFKTEDYHRLYHPDDIELNEVFSYARALFADESQFVEISAKIGRHLYEQSNHPNIKTGELYVVYFKECFVDGMETDAIGIFKSENKDSFLKVRLNDSGISLEHDEGISINKLDKGCLIFNLEEDEGFRCLVADLSSRSGEAVYWKDDFLRLIESKNSYSQTAHFVQMAKSFITEKLPEEFVIEKVDQADLLNRTSSFLKTHDTFTMDDFAAEVMQEPEVINKFNAYKEDYQSSRAFEFDEEVEISESALKKNNKVFKSIIKLDKNFHIYVHGNRDLIQKGTDPDSGMNYYQLFFREEV